jgi:hypothetical protein
VLQAYLKKSRYSASELLGLARLLRFWRRLA